MKRTILSGLAIAALLIGGGAAFAADLAVKSAPPPAPVPVNSWTGFYFDVAAGWQRNSYNWNTDFPGGPFTSSWSSSQTDGSLAGHIGYQQQFGWVVAGLEIGALRGWNNNFNTGAVSAVAGTPTPCGFAGAGLACQNALDSVSTFGGKLGVAWNDWLIYGVGGRAFNANLKSRLVTPAGLNFDQWAPQSTTGWYAGGGFDYMLLKTRLIDLIGGVEYEHINLGSIEQFAQNQGFAPGTFQHSTSAKVDAVWGKLTVKWNPLGN